MVPLDGSVSRRSPGMHLFLEEGFMSKSGATAILVGIDVGSTSHNVAIGLDDGTFLEDFNIHHSAQGFKQFFKRIEKHRRAQTYSVSVAMEGYNGYARPLDSLIQAHDYRLFNVNNLKLARFKEIFPAAAKTDEIDAKRCLELFQFQEYIPTSRRVLQEIPQSTETNRMLKGLTRRRRRLIKEKNRLANTLQTDLRANCPGLLEITRNVSNLWFLHFLTSTDDMRKLKRMHRSSILKIRGIGQTYAGRIRGWQSNACFSPDIPWMGELIQEDACRLLELMDKIHALEKRCSVLLNDSFEGSIINSIQGFGGITAATLAGEIGSISRFKSQNSLAVYLGVAPLKDASGKYEGTKMPKHVNYYAKAAVMSGADKNRKLVGKSGRYYAKKRGEGKKHNQAVRAVGRQLTKVIFKMLMDNEFYTIAA